jgi:hypothetical protein
MFIQPVADGSLLELGKSVSGISFSLSVEEIRSNDCYN